MGRLRLVAFVEGISYLVLLFIAMPLKYALDMPTAVRIVGAVHGALFVSLCLALLGVLIGGNLRFVRSVLVFISSLLPFGTFVIDRYLREWDERPTA